MYGSHVNVTITHYVTYQLNVLQQQRPNIRRFSETKQSENFDLDLVL